MHGESSSSCLFSLPVSAVYEPFYQRNTLCRANVQAYLPTGCYFNYCSGMASLLGPEFAGVKCRSPQKYTTLLECELKVTDQASCPPDYYLYDGLVQCGQFVTLYSSPICRKCPCEGQRIEVLFPI